MFTQGNISVYAAIIIPPVCHTQSEDGTTGLQSMTYIITTYIIQSSEDGTTGLQSLTYIITTYIIQSSEDGTTGLQSLLPISYILILSTNILNLQTSAESVPVDCG